MNVRTNDLIKNRLSNTITPQAVVVSLRIQTLHRYEFWLVSWEFFYFNFHKAETIIKLRWELIISDFLQPKKTCSDICTHFMRQPCLEVLCILRRSFLNCTTTVHSCGQNFTDKCLVVCGKFEHVCQMLKLDQTFLKLVRTCLHLSIFV